MKQNLGVAAALVTAIFSVAVELFNTGYPIYTSMQMAKKQQKEQRLLEELEIVELAQMMIYRFPNVLTYSEWLDLVRTINIVYPPYNVPTGTDWNKYLPYVLIVGIGIIIITRKG